jgi:outer membrane protein assembly factor BamB
MSSSALLTVSPVAPFIVTHPADHNATVGDNVSFTVDANGTAPFTYQWQKDGVDLNSSTTATLTLNGVQPANAGTYRVKVSNAAGSATSNGATLNVGTIPMIVAHPSDANATVGSNVTFDVNATGTPPLAYQWQKKAGNAYNNITGATSSTFTLTDAKLVNSGTYRVVVNSPYGTATSNGALLTMGLAPVFAQQPTDANATIGGSATFSVEVNGTAPLTYQWQKNGVDINGSTANTLTLSNLTEDNNGTYRLIVSNAFGSGTSNGATLQVGYGLKLWEFATEGAVYSSPAIATDGTVYFGSRDNKFYAINPDGTKKWDFPTSHNIESSAAIGSDGTIYFGGVDKKVYALNPDGTKKWEFTTEGYLYSSPAIGPDGTIYIGQSSDDAKLYALNPDGTKKWEFLTSGDAYASPAIASDGTIYFGTYDNKLYALNPDGTKKWEFLAGGWMRSSPAIGADGTVYIGSYDKKLYAINPDGTK